MSVGTEMKEMKGRGVSIDVVVKFLCDKRQEKLSPQLTSSIFPI